MITVRASALKEAMSLLLSFHRMPESVAQLVACKLVETNLMGIDSHGIARIPHYIQRLQQGSIVADPNIRILPNSSSTAVVDGADGHGIQVACRAMEEAIRLGKDTGCSFVAVKNSSHCGAVGLYSRMASREGLIGISSTHSDSFVHPSDGWKAFIGTNPISIAVPSYELDVCLDMATSQITYNSVMNARLTKTRLDTACYDGEGSLTKDPDKVTALPPLGGYKGFGMAFMIEILCGALVSQAMGPRVNKMYEDLQIHRKLGAVFMTIDVAKFIPLELFQTNVKTLVDDLKAMSPRSFYPGEPELKKRNERALNGIPIGKEVLESLDSLLLKANLRTLNRW